MADRDSGLDVCLDQYADGRIADTGDRSEHASDYRILGERRQDSMLAGRFAIER
jgi:hypothetical protein